MKHLTKKTLIVFSGLLLTFYAKSALAQYPGMAAVRASMNRQFIAQQMNMQMMMMANMNSGDYNISQKFTVTLKDSSKKIIKSRFYRDTVAKKNYLLFVDKSYPKSDSNRNKRIYPSQTINISIEIPMAVSGGHGTSTISGYDHINGIPSDSCWMFKAVSGPITAYSYLADAPAFAMPQTIVGIQFNDGPIVKYDENNLKQMVGQDADALNQINKKNLYKAIKKYNRNAEKEKKK